MIKRDKHKKQWPIMVCITKYEVYYKIREFDKIVFLNIWCTLTPKTDPAIIQDLPYIKYKANWSSQERPENASQSDIKSGLELHGKVPSRTFIENFQIKIDKTIHIEWIHPQFVIKAAGEQCEANLGKLDISLERKVITI